jgi:adenosine deaminase
MSGITLTDEFKLAHDLFGFTLRDFREMTIIAMKSAFMPHQKRTILLNKIIEELKQEFHI